MAKQATQNSTQLTAGTISYLGLSQQPYVDSILQTDAIYSDATRDQLLNTLKHHLQFSDLLLVVEGPQGSGKTTLFRQLLQEKHANLYMLPALVDATDTLTQIQLKMSEHLKGQGTANYLDDNLKNLFIFDQIPVLIIDDAHVLSDTTLQELIRYRSKLKQEKDTPLKILLLANPGMAKTLETISDLQHNQMYVQQMPELSAKQVQAFLEHKLARAKYQGDPVFDADTIQTIHKKSRGNPGHVLRLAALLTEKYVMKQSRQGKSPLKLLGYSAATLALAVIIYFGLQQFSATPPPAEVTPIPEIATEPAMELPTDTVPATASEIPPATDAPLVDESPAPMDIESPAAESTATQAPASEPMPAAAAETPAPEIAPAAVAESAPAPAQPQAVDKTQISIKKPVSKPAVTAAPPPPAPVAPSAPAAPAVTNPNNTWIIELAALGIKDATWLRNQPASYWTLQVLGARELKTLVIFARQNKLGEDCAWYETTTNGKPWYVLVYRFYTEAEIARKSVERLPAGLQRSRPWVKSLTSIHKDIIK